VFSREKRREEKRREEKRREEKRREAGVEFGHLFLLRPSKFFQRQYLKLRHAH